MKKLLALMLAIMCLCTSVSVFAANDNPTGFKLDEMVTEDLEGNEVTGEIFSQYKLTYLNLWATWCGPCLSELPHIQAMYEDDDFAARGLNVMGLLWEDSSSTVKTAKKTLKEKGCTYVNIRIGNDQQLIDLVNNSGDGIPVSYLLNSEGEVIKYTVGSMSKSQMKNFINQGFDIVDAEPTPTPTTEPTPTPTTEPTPTAKPAEPVEISYTEDVVLGDANCDGKVNTSDAAWVLKYAAGMFTETDYSEVNINNADANLDGKVDTFDATVLLKHSAEIQLLPAKKTFTFCVIKDVETSVIYTVETYAEFLREPLLKWGIAELDEDGAIVGAAGFTAEEGMSWVLKQRTAEGEETAVETIPAETPVTDGAEFILQLLVV